MKKRLKILFISFILILILSNINFTFAEQSKEGLINLKSCSPRIVIDLKYATADNFLKRKVYDDSNCYVLEELAQKLDKAQKILEQDGLGLKVFDGYRPLSVQKKMWVLLPDSRFVANPRTGSLHNRGAAVDLTLVDLTGRELDMPTPFDRFTECAHQFSKAPTPQQKANRMLLRKVMREAGLDYIRTEWWHYQLPNGGQYPILNNE